MAAHVYHAVVLVSLFTVTVAQQANCGLKYASFYNADLQQVPSINFIFTNNLTIIDAAASVNVSVLYDLTWVLFANRPFVNGSYHGMTLAPSYASDFNSLYNSTLQPLAAAGKVMGAWLGDEMCWNGVTHAELSAAATLVRATWSDAIIYYNEAVPVFTNDVDSWGEPLGYSDVPEAFDWVSVDYYRLDNSSWLYPQYVLYPTLIYPMMHSHQCALTVPGAYGSNANPDFTLGQYETFMPQQAQAYYDWVVTDARMIGMNPWYFTPYASCVADPSSCYYFEIGTSQMPTVAAAWASVGAKIVNASVAAGESGMQRSVWDAQAAAARASSVMTRQEWTRLTSITDTLRGMQPAELMQFTHAALRSRV